MRDPRKHFPGEQFEAQPKIDRRKSSFAKLARLIMDGGAWPTSYPGQPFMSFDALPDSTVPQQIRDLDPERPYVVLDQGDGERILSHGITETYLIEGSTVPVTRHHAGIIKVRKWVFDL